MFDYVIRFDADEPPRWVSRSAGMGNAMRTTCLLHAKHWPSLDAAREWLASLPQDLAKELDGIRVSLRPVKARDGHPREAWEYAAKLTPSPDAGPAKAKYELVAIEVPPMPSPAG